MIVSAKSLSGEYVSIEISDRSNIEEEFERKYKEIYVDPKLHSFISVKLIETAIFYYDEKGNEDVKSDWSFLVNIHRLALCFEFYKESKYLYINPHPYVIEMFEELSEEEKSQNNLYINLSMNPESIKFFMKNPSKICWHIMRMYNERVGEIIHLYEPKSKILKINSIIKYSPNAYEYVCNHPIDQIQWDDFLCNKYIKPEWVQYVIDRKPSVWGENFDTDGNSYGEELYVNGDTLVLYSTPQGWHVFPRIDWY